MGPAVRRLDMHNSKSTEFSCGITSLTQVLLFPTALWFEMIRVMNIQYVRGSYSTKAFYCHAYQCPYHSCQSRTTTAMACGVWWLDSFLQRKHQSLISTRFHVSERNLLQVMNHNIQSSCDDTYMFGRYLHAVICICRMLSRTVLETAGFG